MENETSLADKKKAEGLPAIKLEACEIKPFHKNWEQLPLALDNGEEIFKLCLT